MFLNGVNVDEDGSWIEWIQNNYGYFVASSSSCVLRCMDQWYLFCMDSGAAGWRSVVRMLRLYRFQLIVPETCANLGAEVNMSIAFPGFYTCSNPKFRLVEITNA